MVAMNTLQKIKRYSFVGGEILAVGHLRMKELFAEKNAEEKKPCTKQRNLDY